MAQLAGASDCFEEYGASCVEGSSAGAIRPRASSGSLYSSCVRCAMLVGPLQGVPECCLSTTAHMPLNMSMGIYGLYSGLA